MEEEKRERKIKIEVKHGNKNMGQPILGCPVQSTDYLSPHAEHMIFPAAWT